MNAAAAGWFRRLQVRHCLVGRVRFQYACAPDAPRDAASLERMVIALHGVERVRVNPRAASLLVWFDPALTDVSRLSVALRAMPVPPSLSAPESAQAQAHGASLALTGAALLVSRSLRAGLQAPTSFGAALPLLGEALDDFIEHGITSHVLEAVAVGISIGRKDYFAANTTSFLLALGEYLEARIARRSDNMLCRLLMPTNEAVWVERRGREECLPPEQVRTGDTVIAATGTVIAVDGTVLGGEALVNEATMTGESVPVMRRRGDGVLSGTTVEEGRLRIYAERVGAQAAAARIAEFVQRSLTSKSDTQLAASRMADRLVPMVLALAALTWMASRDWQRVAAVLQADYSCALKLATPVAFKAAMYAAGRSGILVKGAQALERLAEADSFVFDKTGTLTHGRLEVTDSVALASGYRPEDLLNLAASVEEHYFHPLARAVVEASQQLDASRHFDHTEVEFIVAHGVASEIDGRRIVVGSRHFLEDHEGICVRTHAQTIETLARRGRTLLYVGYDQQLLGVIGLRDTLRENTAHTLARLRAQGVRHIAMITGDCADNAQALARQLGLDAFYADVLPEDKAAIVEQMRAQGARVAFVGDGVNDAPALSCAHVGISMHRGADIARLASDIALLEDDIARVADACALAQGNRRRVNNNFRLAVGLNSAILGAAAFGWLRPVSTSMLHNGSTIGILLHALLGARLPGARRSRSWQARERMPLQEKATCC